MNHEILITEPFTRDKKLADNAVYQHSLIANCNILGASKLLQNIIRIFHSEGRVRNLKILLKRPFSIVPKKASRSV